MAARRNIQESSSNGHSLSGEKTRSDTSDLDTSETEALFTQIADYFDPGKPSHSSSDKKESRQTRDRKEKVTSNSAARPNTSNNVLQMLPSCSYVLPSGHHDQRIESSLSHTGEHFFPKPGRFESRGHRGFGASEDWQSGSNNPCDIESLYTHPESLRTHEPSMPAATRNISRSPRRKRNRWSSDDSVSFLGPDEETGHMNDEEYAKWLQQQIDIEDYWRNRLQMSNPQDASFHESGRRGNMDRFTIFSPKSRRLAVLTGRNCQP
ncbi:hypothetical protein C0Q70_05294 [Pomacea canaliculata]|uniref:Uncharacterized protein n=1 Tax=Pomacea canaliculata TaxID=400727 RepID=A0A2T7PKV6_POMCA|nr:hypothetical protein C0Q70_05294 [Pomacea canaliculata]